MKNNTVGAHPGIQAHLVKVRITINDSVRGDTTSLWTIRDLPPGGSVVREVKSLRNSPAATSGPEKVPQRLYAKITESDPEEAPRFRSNNATENWVVENRHDDGLRGVNGIALYTNGDVAVGDVRISDRNPQPGGATTFTVAAYNSSNANRIPGILRDGHQDHTLFEVQVKISLSPGLSFAETQPDPPSGTMFDTATGIWNVGTMGIHQVNMPLSLPVAVDLAADSLAALPLEERCLTAKVVSQVPRFASDPSKRLNDNTTACLGKVVLAQGETTLFHYVDCVGVTSTPCTSTDTLELVVERQTDSYLQHFQPEAVIVHIQDPQGRVAGKWRTGKTTYHNSSVDSTSGVQATFSFLPRSYNSYTFMISDVSPKQRPGAFSIIGGGAATVTILDADTKKSLGPLTLPPVTTTNPYPAFLSVSALGTYKVQLTFGATKSSTPYSDSVTYTVHAGPMADLEVRDAGANPEVAADRRAYTILAVNNGPEVSVPAVRVTLTGVPEGAEAVPSQGSYAEGTCQNGLCEGVWTIGELKPGYANRPSVYAREGPALTLITATGDPITAAIENTQDYCVRIKTADPDPENDLACAAGSVPTGYTDHSIPYYDHVEGNNTTTVALRDGTGVSLSAPKGVKVMETPVANILTWQPVEKLYGYAVTHYEVQQSASPWMTVALDVEATKNPVYLDMAPAIGDPAYRVRAVNEFGFPGPWSMAATPHMKPGRPKSLTAAGQSDTVAGLSWSAPDTVASVTVSGYDLEFSEDGGATWTSLATGQSATSYTHTDAALTAASLTPDILRQYRARTVGTIDGSTVKSDWATAILTHPTPGVPATFAAAGQSETQASLSWSAPAVVTHVSVTGYELGFSKDGGASWATVTGTPTLSRSTWSLTHSDSGLAADAVRQYRARTLGTVGSVTVKSGWAYALATENYPAPGAPRNFAARAIDRSQVNLSWTVPVAVSGVTHTGYHLEFSSDGNTWNWLPVGDTRTVLPATATSHPHVNDALAPGALRQYRLRAVGTANNASFESGWVFASAATEAVGPPRNLAAARDGISRIDLTWDEPGFGADRVTGYRIDYALGGSDDWRTLEHGYRSTPRSYEHTRLHTGDKLQPGQRYCYRVAAVYAGGTGPFADGVCATTEGAPESKPGKPENLRIARMGSNYVTLEWDPPSVGGAAEYYEWGSTAHDPAEVSPRTATSVRVGGLAPGSTYEFHVRAGNSYGAGEWSLPVQAMLNRASGAVKVSPMDLEVEKGGSGSFNVRLNRPPRWPLLVYFHPVGADCLTESLTYQQGKILLPGNPPPSKEFWEDGWWGPPEDRWAVPYNTGLDIEMDASGCRGGETAVVQPDFSSLPLGYLDGMPMWEDLGLSYEEWEDKWGIDQMDGTSGPSVKVTVVDGAQQRSRQSGPGVKSAVSDTTPEQQQGPPNQPPAVSAAIADAAIVNESGTRTVSLSGVFDDADGDSLTVTAASSDEAVATVSVASDYSGLTVNAQSRGTATVTVTANDGNGGTVEDAFTVKVKAAPVVASAISDLGMEAEATQDIDLAGVFSDADGDALTITADTSDFEVVEAILFQGALTVIAVADGSATVTVTAEDSDGNTVSDTFDVSVVGPPTPAANLRCIAETGRVAFLWDAPTWSGGETYAYDYDLTLPDGRSEGGRLIGITTLLRTGEYQAGSEASVSVKTVYELADGSEVYSAAETLTCTVAE